MERRFKDPCDPTLVMETMCLDVINAVIVKRDQGLTTSGVRRRDHSAILRFSETAVRLQTSFLLQVRTDLGLSPFGENPRFRPPAGARSRCTESSSYEL